MDSKLISLQRLSIHNNIRQNLLQNVLKRKRLDFLTDTPPKIDLKTSEFVKKLRISFQKASNQKEIKDFIDKSEWRIILKWFTDQEMMKEEHIQKEMLWLFANIAVFASKETVHSMVKTGLLSKCIEICKCEEGLRNFAIWTIGNLVEDSPVRRDEIIKSGIASSQYVGKSLDIARDFSFLLKILSKIKPVRFTDQLLELLMNILAEFNDAECDLNCLVTLANFFQNDELSKIIMRRLKISKTIFLVNFLLRKFCIIQKSIVFSSENYIFVLPLLKILSKIEIDEMKQDLYDFLNLMLEYKEAEVKILSLDIIAKLFENNKIFISLDSVILDRILDLFKESNKSIRKNSIRTLYSINYEKNILLVDKMVDCGVINILCEILNEEKNNIKLDALKLLEKLLIASSNNMLNENYVALSFEYLGGERILSRLADCSNSEIKEKSMLIRKIYFL